MPQDVDKKQLRKLLAEKVPQREMARVLRWEHTWRRRPRRK